MANKNIRKEIKKPKKSAKAPSASAVAKPIMIQPELIKKEKKPK
jgi:hypothetical protein